VDRSTTSSLSSPLLPANTREANVFDRKAQTDRPALVAGRSAPRRGINEQALLTAALVSISIGYAISSYAFDIKSYCRQVSDAVGGSYQIEETCRQQEETPKQASPVSKSLLA